MPLSKRTVLVSVRFSLALAGEEMGERVREVNEHGIFDQARYEPSTSKSPDATNSKCP